MINFKDKLIQEVFVLQYVISLNKSALTLMLMSRETMIKVTK